MSLKLLVASSLVIGAVLPVVSTPAQAMAKHRRGKARASFQDQMPDPAPLPLPSPVATQAPSTANGLAANERLITILQTNDIHGGVEPQITKKGEKVGGSAMLAGVVSSIRQGLNAKYGSQSGVLTVDGGDQFQGTLISNFNEGQLVFAVMNEVGYDAAITGNHDYDFGPIGWLDDQVTAQTQDQDPRGALKRDISQARFPILSANTYLKDASGKCTTQHPSYLKPYLVKTVAGDVRVALIGIDNPGTPETTTQANVADLCFGDEAEGYLRAREELEGKADVFVMIIHDGNSLNEFGATKLLQKIVDQGEAQGRRLIDAVAAGHTHFVNNVRVKGVPLIQSGSGGDMFGRIDLVYDTQARTVLIDRTQVAAGVQMGFAHCAQAASSFCSETGDGNVAYEGVPVTLNSRIQALIAAARADVAPLAGRKLGVADGPLTVNRISESSMADVLTDGLRALSGADVAFMNTGGIRAPIDAGEVTYEQLFKVIPFNNRGVLMYPMPAETLLALVGKSIQTCGNFGALMQSGLRVSFSRDCASAKGGTDPTARLLHVETLSGEVILDAAKGIQPASGRVFTVATLDFLAAGGSGFDGFKGVPITRDLGIVRELLADQYEKALAQGRGTLSSKTDGRWAENPASPQ